MPRLHRILFLTLLAAIGPVSHAHAQDHSGNYPPIAIENGALLYGANCAQCHGIGGDTVPGVALKTGTFKRAPTDQDLARLLTTGIPGTAMPATRLSPGEADSLVAYLRTMRDFNSPAVMAGNSTRGRGLFEGKGTCTTCHRVNASGSHVAPDLSDVGANRGADFLWRKIQDPSATMIPLNRPVHIVLKSGRAIDGRRLNEDTYSIQLIDNQERLISVMKSDVKEFSILKTSPMPSFKDRLAGQELADLVSFLVSLKGEN
ncbi:MAG: c-type cytochrome [Vicinamibacterales bacterium]|nr:c-type cytochrome [Vicinamibacterales bacterium]